MMRSLLPLMTLVVGCSYDNALGYKTGADDTSVATDPNDTGDEDDDTAPPIAPAWFVVRADLVIGEGAPRGDGATVEIDVVDEDLARVDCTVELDATGTAPATVDGADATTLWWEVPVVPREAPCATLPESLTVGVGALHPDARARLGTVGHDDIADALYGAWLVVDGAPAVYGYAGTATDLLGDGAATLPPPDGLYRLAPLYLVALPD